MENFFYRHVRKSYAMWNAVWLGMKNCAELQCTQCAHKVGKSVSLIGKDIQHKGPWIGLSPNLLSKCIFNFGKILAVELHHHYSECAHWSKRVTNEPTQDREKLPRTQVEQFKRKIQAGMDGCLPVCPFPPGPWWHDRRCSTLGRRSGSGRITEIRKFELVGSQGQARGLNTVDFGDHRSEAIVGVLEFLITVSEKDETVGQNKACTTGTEIKEKSILLWNLIWYPPFCL